MSNIKLKDQEFSLQAARIAHVLILQEDMTPDELSTMRRNASSKMSEYFNTEFTEDERNELYNTDPFIHMLFDMSHHLATTIETHPDVSINLNNFLNKENIITNLVNIQQETISGNQEGDTQRGGQGGMMERWLKSAKYIALGAAALFGAAQLSGSGQDAMEVPHYSTTIDLPVAGTLRVPGQTIHMVQELIGVNQTPHPGAIPYALVRDDYSPGSIKPFEESATKDEVNKFMQSYDTSVVANNTLIKSTEAAITGAGAIDQFGRIMKQKDCGRAQQGACSLLDRFASVATEPVTKCSVTSRQEFKSQILATTEDLTEAHRYEIKNQEKASATKLVESSLGVANSATQMAAAIAGAVDAFFAFDPSRLISPLSGPTIRTNLVNKKLLYEQKQIILRNRHHRNKLIKETGASLYKLQVKQAVCAAIVRDNPYRMTRQVVATITTAILKDDAAKAAITTAIETSSAFIIEKLKTIQVSESRQTYFFNTTKASNVNINTEMLQNGQEMENSFYSDLESSLSATLKDPTYTMLESSGKLNIQLDSNSHKNNLTTVLTTNSPLSGPLTNFGIHKSDATPFSKELISSISTDKNVKGFVLAVMMTERILPFLTQMYTPVGTPYQYDSKFINDLVEVILQHTMDPKTHPTAITTTKNFILPIIKQHVGSMVFHVNKLVIEAQNDIRNNLNEGIINQYVHGMVIDVGKALVANGWKTDVAGRVASLAVTLTYKSGMSIADVSKYANAVKIVYSQSTGEVKPGIRYANMNKESTSRHIAKALQKRGSLSKIGYSLGHIIWLFVEMWGAYGLAELLFYLASGALKDMCSTCFEWFADNIGGIFLIPFKWAYDKCRKCGICLGWIEPNEIEDARIKAESAKKKAKDALELIQLKKETRNLQAKAYAITTEAEAATQAATEQRTRNQRQSFLDQIAPHTQSLGRPAAQSTQPRIVPRGQNLGRPAAQSTQPRIAPHTQSLGRPAAQSTQSTTVPHTNYVNIKAIAEQTKQLELQRRRQNQLNLEAEFDDNNIFEYDYENDNNTDETIKARKAAVLARVAARRSASSSSSAATLLPTRGKHAANQGQPRGQAGSACDRLARQGGGFRTARKHHKRSHRTHKRHHKKARPTRKRHHKKNRRHTR
jgi:hypothetical protein